MNGKALLEKKKYKDAIDVLENGLDFIVDDSEMELDFYQQLSKCFEITGDLKKYNDYKQKVEKLK